MFFTCSLEITYMAMTGKLFWSLRSKQGMTRLKLEIIVAEC